MLTNLFYVRTKVLLRAGCCKVCIKNKADRFLSRRIGGVYRINILCASLLGFLKWILIFLFSITIGLTFTIIGTFSARFI